MFFNIFLNPREYNSFLQFSIFSIWIWYTYILYVNTEYTACLSIDWRPDPCNLKKQKMLLILKNTVNFQNVATLLAPCNTPYNTIRQRSDILIAYFSYNIGTYRRLVRPRETIRHECVTKIQDKCFITITKALTDVLG